MVGYCRVSTEEQAREGVSLAAQEERLTQYAALYGHELVGVFVDAGLSGKSLERPELQKALALLDRGAADGLLVAKLDRLTRRLDDLRTLIREYFEDGKAHLLSVSEQLDTHSAGGRLLIHILASVAEWERETIAERIKDALGHLKANGVQLGAVPLGLARTKDKDADGRFVLREDEEEKETVDRILFLRSSGYSLRGIADTMVMEKRKTKFGGKWQAQTVASILKRTRRAGDG